MRATLIAALAVLALAAPAGAQTATVHVQFDAFGPGRVDVLPGETVLWQNVSERAHTVSSDDGAFDSGELAPQGAFGHGFAAAGTYPYRCMLHPTMTGEVEVSPVLLDPLPTQAVPVGDPVTFAGRTADPAHPVRIERAVGEDWRTVATTTPGGDGTWSVEVPAQASAEHRAASVAGASRSRPLLVSDREVRVQRTARGIAVGVFPPLPYGRIVLQRHLRDRFGWWITRRVKLDYRSRAHLSLRGRAPARVVLVAEDRWTPLATSRVIGRRPPAPPAPHAHHGTS